jgi:hypothetical protein
MDRTLTGLANRAGREVVARVPPVRLASERRYRNRRGAHRPRLPALHPADAALIAQLDRDGVAVTDLDSLGLADTAGIKAALLECVQLLAARPAGKESSLFMTHEELVAYLPLWRMGLSEKLLALAENHIGLPLTYHGAFVARQIADGRVVGTRQWHRDIEDHRMMKILMWLNDVDADGGALAYVPRSRSAQVDRALRYVGGFVDDEVMARTAPPHQVCLTDGPQWTAVLLDPARVFHRGTPPRAADRYALTLTWTSTHPVKSMPNEPFTPAEARLIRAGLTDRQLACLRADMPA